MGERGACEVESPMQQWILLLRRPPMTEPAPRRCRRIHSNFKKPSGVSFEFFLVHLTAFKLKSKLFTWCVSAPMLMKLTPVSA